MSGWTIRDARPDDLTQMMTILDAALLDIEATEVRAACGPGSRRWAFIAVADDRVLGTLVLAATRIEAIAVRRARRGQGIGSALVDRACRAHPSVTARCDGAVRPFYESMDFDCHRIGPDRYACHRSSWGGVASGSG